MPHRGCFAALFARASSSGALRVRTESSETRHGLYFECNSSDLTPSRPPVITEHAHERVGRPPGSVWDWAPRNVLKMLWATGGCGGLRTHLIAYGTGPPISSMISSLLSSSRVECVSR
eukprot:762625-Prymnesium_polylepis.1